MTVTPTARLGINTWPLGTDQYLRAQRNADAAKLDDLVAIDLQGTLAGRPAAGIRGRYYFATDDNGGRLYRDTGAAWVRVGGDADTLDGLDSTAFLLAGATAADSNKLGGISAPLYLLTSDANAAYNPLSLIGRYKRAATQSIANATLAAVTWDTVIRQDGVSNTVPFSTVTLPSQGWYHIEAEIRWAQNGTGLRTVVIRNAAGVYLADDDIGAQSGSTTIHKASTVSYFASGALTFEVLVQQNSGGALNVDAFDEMTHLSVMKVRS